MERKLTLQPKMRDTWLIQRLCKPQGFGLGKLQFKDNPFSFGGGLKNGGLSENAMGLLRDILSFDYMGSSEFEWGAVPNALSFLGEQAVRANLVAGEFFHRNNTDVVIYYLCPIQYKDEVIARINLLCEHKIPLKESALIDLFFSRPSYVSEPFYARHSGWLELDNGFMFFTDKVMFDKVIKLFGIKEGL